MRIRILLICVSIFACTITVIGQQYNLNFEYEGITRKYHLYVPATYDGQTAVPLIVNHHGATSNGPQQLLYSNMLPVADTANFIIVYPDGIANVWNSGFLTPYSSGPDDVGFISSLIQYLGTQYNIDPAKVYSCGMSNGGYQSFRLACELEDKIAAIASVTGSMADSVAFYCQNNRSVPVFQIHGTDDPTVPYSGLQGAFFHQDSLIQWWINKNGCGMITESDTFPDIVLTDSSRTVYYRYNNCTDGSEVWFYKVLNGAHTWPGALLNIGVTNQDIIASEEIWKFFRRHSHPNPTTSDQAVVKPDWVFSFQNPIDVRLEMNYSGSENVHVRLHDLSGKVLMSKSIVTGSSSIDCGNLDLGYYILTLTGETVSQSYKVLKN